METIETIDYKGYTINIYRLDEALDTPRADDNLGSMVCFHGKYDLGDKHDYKHDDFNSWEALKEQIIKDHNPIVILPLFLYDHSDISIKTFIHGVHASWDGGWVGFIFVSKEKIKKEYKVKKISAKLKKTIENNLIAEVETYNDYLQGNIYGYTVEKDGERLDSCGGYYGDYDTSGLLTEAQGNIDYYIKEALKQHGTKLKAQIKHNVGLEHREPLLS
jgi:hypothetical protein